MTENNKVLEKLDTLIEGQNRIVEMLHKKGYSSELDIKKLIEMVKMRKTINRETVCREFQISSPTALKLMKRIDKVEGIRYGIGIGRVQSFLMCVEPNSVTDKAFDIVNDVPKKSSMTIDEAMKKFKINGDDEFWAVIRKIRDLFSNVIFTQNGKLVRSGL
ncbi:MAG: hypothetical protein NTU57_00315 [Candidatus Aenigmarchaeota archaeon]|nr:hypothetical protein [Candidatus Aenigmarchaeota archaeon]